MPNSEEELIVRPTSETIIWNTYKRAGSVLPRPADPLQPVGERRTRWEMRTLPVPAHGEFLSGRRATCHEGGAIEGGLPG